MTTLSEAREAVYAKFVANWKDSLSADLSPYTFDNESFTPPTTESWVRVALRHSVSDQETLGASGNRKFSRTGNLYIQVFTPTDGGTSDADILCQKIRDIFEGVTLPGTTIRFQSTTVTESGNDGKWLQMLAETPFEYDETK